MKNNLPYGLVLGLLALAGLTLGACTTAQVGAIRGSQEVTRDFEELRLNPDFRYWYLNQENEPYGVAGLSGGFWIRDPAWREVDPASPTFEKVVELVKRFPVPGSYTEGFVILDPQGNAIGVWYSSLGAGITVDPDTRQVMIATATPWLGR